MVTLSKDVPLIFLPSLSYKASLWSEISKPLQHLGYKTVMLDLPEYATYLSGLKMDFVGLNEYVNRELSKRNITEYVLVGHSLGGLVSTINAANNSNVRGAVLVSSPLKDPSHKYPLVFRILINIGNKLTFITRFVETIARHIARTQKTKSPIASMVPALKYVGFVESMPLKNSVACYYDLKGFNFSPYVENVTCPVLFIYGENDYFFNYVGGGAGLFKSFPNAKIHSLNGEHSLPYSHPEDLFNLIQSFLEDIKC
jgi:pimeloyl-ACP methyl ester carboxylesterase